MVQVEGCNTIVTTQGMTCIHTWTLLGPRGKMAGPASLPRLHLPLPTHWRLACFGTGTGSGVIITTIACFGTHSSTMTSIGSGIIIATIACFGTCSGTMTSIGCSTAGRHGDSAVVDAGAGGGFCMRGAGGTGMGLWVGWEWKIDEEGSEGRGGGGVRLGCGTCCGLHCKV